MRTRSRAVLGVLIAAVLVALAAQAAVAANFRVDEQRIRVVWPSEEKLFITKPEGGVEVLCAATLEGSFHRSTFVKSFGGLVGYITRAAVAPIANCAANNVTELRVLPETLPWHIRYGSFSGMLPNINEIRFSFLEFAFLMTVFGTSCLYRSRPENPLWIRMLTESGTTVVGWRAEEGESALRNSGSTVLCPASIRYGDVGHVTRLGSTTERIHISLI